MWLFLFAVRDIHSESAEFRGWATRWVQPLHSCKTLPCCVSVLSRKHNRALNRSPPLCVCAHCTAAASIPEASESFQLNQAKKQMGNDNSKSSKHPGQQICLVSHSRHAGTIHVSFSEQWFSWWNLSDVVFFPVLPPSSHPPRLVRGAPPRVPTGLHLLHQRHGGQPGHVEPQGNGGAAQERRPVLAERSGGTAQDLRRWVLTQGAGGVQVRILYLLYTSTCVLSRIQRLTSTFRVLASYRTTWQWNGG